MIITDHHAAWLLKDYLTEVDQTFLDETLMASSMIEYLLYQARLNAEGLQPPAETWNDFTLLFVA